MNEHNSQDKRFDALLKEITTAEAGLRSCFEDTPRPTPEALTRIKSRLRAEASPRRRTWLAWAGAIAAAIALAVGAGLYFQLQPSPVTIKGPAGTVTADAGDASLEAFTASLPAVLRDEDPAMQQFSSDLKELESQTSTAWSNG